MCFGESCVVENESDLSSATGEISHESLICGGISSDRRTKKGREHNDSRPHTFFGFSLQFKYCPSEISQRVTAQVQSQTLFASPFCHR